MMSVEMRGVRNASKLGASSMSSKRERRSKYTAEEDRIILREVAAAKVHIAPYRKTFELF